MREESSYYDIISAVDDFFDQWNPNTATPIEKNSQQDYYVEKQTSFLESILVSL